jgi:xylulokinase
MFGCHVAPGLYYWMGSLSAAGGSIEWARALLNDPPLSYAALDALAEAAPDAATGVIYLPYLAGSGAPHLDANVRGALYGLNSAHGRAEFARAVFEGTAYELEYVRRAAEAATRQRIQLVRAAGGGTRSRPWMQIKADVTNCRYEVPILADATLLGAALLAGVACGRHSNALAALQAVKQAPAQVVAPRPGHSERYRALYEAAYLPLQEPLRTIASSLRDL